MAVEPEVMVAGPAPLSRRWRVGLTVVVAIALLGALLTGSGPPPPCPPEPAPSPPEPWLTADDPRVANLRASVLQRPQTARDRLPRPQAALVSREARRGARLALELDDTLVYLAGGPGFLCLIVANPKEPRVSETCVLNSTVVNVGLWGHVSTNNDDRRLVVVRPDGYSTRSLTPAIQLVAAGDNVTAFVATGTGTVLLEAPSHPTVRIENEEPTYDIATGETVVGTGHCRV